MKMITTGSDFSGVGAFDYAIERVAKKKGFKHKRVYACDWDKYARITYAHNHGEPDYYPKDVYDREVPKDSLDIYMTSPPCQAFSLAGKRKGKDDERGILFFNSHEFIQKNQPRFFIFENVKGLLSDDNGKTFQEWINMLGGKSVNGLPILFKDENTVDYHIYWKVLNSKKHGVPQNRERVFIVGIRDDQDNNFTFPKEEHLTKKLKDVLETDVDEKYYLSEKMLEALLRKGSDFEGAFQPHDENDISKCLTARYFNCNQAVIQLNNPKHSNDRIYSDKGCSPTLNTMQGGNRQPFMHLSETSRIRRLTPRECFRLQDFDDTFDFSVVSDTQAYKQAGNSITVRVLEKIIEKLPL
jgi:DNA (cytosine-5)-methyltransferase 1